MNFESWAVAAFQVVLEKTWDGISSNAAKTKKQNEVKAAVQHAATRTLEQLEGRAAKHVLLSLEAVQPEQFAKLTDALRHGVLSPKETLDDLVSQTQNILSMEGKTRPGTNETKEALETLLKNLRTALVAVDPDLLENLAKLSGIIAAETLTESLDVQKQSLETQKEILDLSRKNQKPELEFPEDDYRQAVLTVYGKPTFAGVLDSALRTQNQNRNLSVGDLFVEPESQTESQPENRPDVSFLAADPDFDPSNLSAKERRNYEYHSLGLKAPTVKTRPVLTMLQEEQHVVILGSPGSGKSTLLRHLVALACQKKLSQDLKELPQPSDAAILPIMIRVRDYLLNEKVNLLEYLTQQLQGSEGQFNCEPAALRQGLEEALIDGRCLVCIDGLDEYANNDQRQRIVNSFQHWRNTYPKNRFVITSRIAGYNSVALPSSLFAQEQLLPLNDAKIQAFLANWFRHHEDDPRAKQEKPKKLWEVLEQRGNILAMARNPLLLTIIALVYQPQVTLPAERAKLYKECTDLLVGEWSANFGQPLSEHELEKPHHKDRDHILRQLAWKMQQGKNETQERFIISRAQLKKDVTEILCTYKISGAYENEDLAEKAAQDFIHLVEHRIGLFNYIGNDTFEFAHASFQEFYAAQALYRSRDTAPSMWEKIKDKWYDPKWREVVLLMLGLTSDDYEGVADAVLSELEKSGKNDQLEPFLNRHLDFGLVMVADKIRLDGKAKEALIQHGLREKRWGVLAQCKNEAAVTTGLLSLVRDKKVDDFIRRRVTEALGLIGEKTETAKALLTLVIDKRLNDSVRCSAISALGMLGEKTEVVILELLFLAQNENQNYDIRLNSAEALSMLAREGEAAKVLLALARDKNAHIYFRYNAIQALCEFKEKTQVVINGLLLLAQDKTENHEARSYAAEGLGKLGEKTKEIINGLLALIRDKNENGHILLSAAKALGKLGEKTEATNVMLALAQNENEETELRLDVLMTLARLSEKTQLFVNNLLVLVRNKAEDNDVRCGTAEILGIIGEKTGAIINELLVLIQDKTENDYVRGSAARALGKLGEKTEVIINGLLVLSSDKDGDGYVPLSAANALARLGEKTKAVNILVSLAQDENEDVYIRYSSAEELITVGEKTKTVINSLLGLAQNKNIDNSIRSSAAFALRTLALEHPPIPKATP